MKHLVVFTGAGISAESGIKTFRDSGGLWEKHDVQQIACIESWHNNKALMLDFYNQRRQQLKETQPNQAHIILAELEKYYRVSIITQNVDNLHERAGSTNVLHLHGELTKACNEDKTEIIDINYDDINIGDQASDGSQLRPFVVWFGENVPLLNLAVDMIGSADIVVVIGTSLQVQPAAGLLNYTPTNVSLFLIDPNPKIDNRKAIIIQKNATQGITDFKNILMSNEKFPEPSFVKETDPKLIACEEAIKNDPENPNLWIMKSELLGLSGRYNEAMLCQDKAMNLLNNLPTDI